MGEEEMADFQKNTFDYYDPQIILLDMTLKSQKKGVLRGIPLQIGDAILLF